MTIIDGKHTSQKIKENIKIEIDKLASVGKAIPGLVTVLVGENPASRVYVRMKHKACEKTGLRSKQITVPEEISETELLKIIDECNADDDYHGILVQLPLPDHIDEQRVINRIATEKDVDGFHPQSVGNLVIGNDTFFPCTPFGIVELLKEYGIETSGKHVVVVGRSNIVGKPIANMLLQKREFANAVVTVCHSAAKDLSYFTKQADIVIAAIGRANFITAEMVKDGAVVIDVGINRLDAPETDRGYRIVGDVDFGAVSEKASFITPVPGGVGPMTIAMLLQNTLKAYHKINS